MKREPQPEQPPESSTKFDFGPPFIDFLDPEQSERWKEMCPGCGQPYVKHQPGCPYGKAKSMSGASLLYNRVKVGFLKEQLDQTPYEQRTEAFVLALCKKGLSDTVLSQLDEEVFPQSSLTKRMAYEFLEAQKYKDKSGEKQRDLLEKFAQCLGYFSEEIQQELADELVDQEVESLSREYQKTPEQLKGNYDLFEWPFFNLNKKLPVLDFPAFYQKIRSALVKHGLFGRINVCDVLGISHARELKVPSADLKDFVEVALNTGIFERVIRNPDCLLAMTPEDRNAFYGTIMTAIETNKPRDIPLKIYFVLFKALTGYHPDSQLDHLEELSPSDKEKFQAAWGPGLGHIMKKMMQNEGWAENMRELEQPKVEQLLTHIEDPQEQEELRQMLLKKG